VVEGRSLSDGLWTSGSVPSVTTVPPEAFMGVIVQILGSLFVLAGFALAQWGVLDLKSRRYLALNTVGSTVLALDAVVEQQWGFLLLEGVWAVVSAVGLIGVLRSGKPHHAE
jgi:hypothetical protein